MHEQTRPRLRDLLVYLSGVALLAACVVVLWRSMRAVMDIGGMCASGGPYVIAVECPEGVDLLLPASILVGVAAVGIVAWFGGRVGPGFGAVAALAWPALFLSMGWNFLEYAFASPGGWDLSWLICGVLFVAMGGIPLLFALRAMRGGTRPAAWTPGGVTILTRPTPGASPRHVDLARALRQVRATTAQEAARTTVAEATGTPEATGTTEPAGLVEQLERLARLKEQGALGELEYLQAKQAVIEAAAKGGEA